MKKTYRPRKRQVMLALLVLLALLGAAFPVAGAQADAPRALPAAAEAAGAGQNEAAAGPLPATLGPSYTYSYWGQPVLSPDPYLIEAVVTGLDLGCGDFNEPLDICVDANGSYYVADSMNNRVVRFSQDLRLERIYQSVDDTVSSLKRPSGVFVAADGRVYVADTENGRIVVFSPEGETLAVLDTPEDALLGANFVYRPLRLAVDKAGRIFVIASAVNQGIISLNPEGGFEGFLAAAKVDPDPLQVLWKRLATEEQRARMSNFVPIEYNSLDLDSEGFLYTITTTVDADTVMAEVEGRSGTEQGSPVRRINMNGQDILRREGYFPPVGDVYDLHNQAPSYSGISGLVDVAAGANNTYTVLDNNRKKLFTYDVDGFLLYAFGTPGASAGGFETPVALAADGARLLVLDKKTCAVTVYTMTDYARAVHGAIEHYNHGRYAQAEGQWQLVMQANANQEVAYCGMGRAAYRDGRYAEAMEYFRLGNNKEWYSKAYEQQRKDSISALLPFVLALLAVLVGLWLWRKWRRRKEGTE